jgi:hypothetical protein
MAVAHNFEIMPDKFKVDRICHFFPKSKYSNNSYNSVYLQLQAVKDLDAGFSPVTPYLRAQSFSP